MRQARAEQTDEALAVWSDTHPGREREALQAALNQEQRRGNTITHPAGFFATWTRDRRARIQLPLVTSTCSKCHGTVWLYDETTDPPTLIGKCDHTQGAA